MEFDFMTGAIEAVLFASGEPIEVQKLAQTLETDVDAVKEAVERLNEYYESDQRGFEIVELENSYQMTTRVFYGEITRLALDHRRNTPLSNAALEILAIVAYNQPVTRSYIDQVRGVDSAYSVGVLTERELIEEKGRMDVPGRPRLYGTTEAFLRVFGLSDISELPPLPSADGAVV